MTKGQRLLRLFPGSVCWAFFGFLGLLPKFNGHPNYFSLFFWLLCFFFYYHLRRTEWMSGCWKNRKRAAAVMLSFLPCSPLLCSFCWTVRFRLTRCCWWVPWDTRRAFVLAPALTLFFDRKAY